MKICQVINKQEENYWAELYSAEWKGREIGREEIVEKLIENSGFSLEQISKILKLPLHQIEEINANMEHSIP